MWERFFDFSGAFTVPYIQWDRQEAFADHNIFTTLVKYAVFGEADYSRVADTVRVVSVLMLWATMVLLLLLLAGIVLFLGDQTIAVHVRTLVLVCIAVIFAMYKPIAEDDHEKLASLMKFYGTAYKVIGCAVALFGLALLPFLDLIIRPNCSKKICVRLTASSMPAAW